MFKVEPESNFDRTDKLLFLIWKELEKLNNKPVVEEIKEEIKIPIIKKRR